MSVCRRYIMFIQVDIRLHKKVKYICVALLLISLVLDRSYLAYLRHTGTEQITCVYIINPT